ncbi:MAG: ADOP family duplicated permease [Longimicrobiales bacterium]
MRRIRLWLLAVFRSGAVEGELTDELRHHIELETEKNIRAGMGPVAARRKALIDFGGEERYKEQTREARSTRPLEDVLLDLRYGLRQLRKHPGFTSVALLSLALGIGANTAIFSVVNAVLLRPLPFQDPDRILVVEELAAGERNPTFSPRDFLDLKEQASSFEHVIGFRTGSMTLTGGPLPERLRSYSVTADFFQAFGVDALVGRFFEATPEEDRAGKMVVLGYGLWQNRFGQDPGIVGRSLSLNGEPHTVLGVAPATFRFPSDAELWVRSYRDGVPEPPVDIGDDLASVRGLGYFSVAARLAPGVSLEAAQTETDLLARRLAEIKEAGEGQYRIQLVPLGESLVGDVRPALLLLLGAVGLVLLIACANVANLLLARSATRVQELAVRASLGASRPRLFRQLLVESLLLGVVAGGAGLVLARWGFGALLSLLPTDIPRLEGIALDGTVLLFTLAAALLTGILFGLLPALDASRTDLTGAIKVGGRGVVGAGRSRRTRETLVVAEVALSVVLLSGAGLILKSLLHLQAEDVGFDPRGVLVARMNLPEARYPEEEAMALFVRELLAEVEALPGVTTAGVALGAPFAGGAATMTYDVEGIVPAEGEEYESEYQVITSDYFRTMGIPILEGRGLEPADDEGDGGPRVAVVSQAFARRHWGETSPLGQRISFGGGEAWMEIVGVSGNVRHFSFEQAPRPEVYVPYMRDPWPFLSLVVKTSVDPVTLVEPVRQAGLRVDPDQALYGVRPMTRVLRESTGQRRFTMELLGLFAALAMGLALVGVYGVMAYMVNLRVHEMGIRIALGAPRDQILRLSLRGGIRLAVFGLILGVGGSLAVTRIMGSLLYGVNPWDPGVLSLTGLLLTGSVIAAAYLPARRAAGLDPAEVLRGE